MQNLHARLYHSQETVIEIKYFLHSEIFLLQYIGYD